MTFDDTRDIFLTHSSNGKAEFIAGLADVTFYVTFTRAEPPRIKHCTFVNFYFEKHPLYSKFIRMYSYEHMRHFTRILLLIHSLKKFKNLYSK